MDFSKPITSTKLARIIEEEICKKLNLFLESPSSYPTDAVIIISERFNFYIFSNKEVIKSSSNGLYDSNGNLIGFPIENWERSFEPLYEFVKIDIFTFISNNKIDEKAVRAYVNDNIDLGRFIQNAPLLDYNRKRQVIDLFSGCGGLSLGFEDADYEIALAIDNWEDALVTYRKNHLGTYTLNADLKNLDPIKVQEDFCLDSIDVIIGGPPCQGFSVAGKRIIDDDRNKLYKSFVRFVEHFMPRAFVMENVPNILTIGDGVIKEAIIKDFSELGYNVQYKVLNSSDYGVPQNRRRAFFVGLRFGKYTFPKPTTDIKVTTKEAISDLPEETVKDGDIYPNEPQSEYQRLMRANSSVLYNHQATMHTAETKRIIAMVPDGQNYKCLPKEMWSLRKVHIAWTRMDSKKPSFTIDTGHNHHFHYSYNRVPTVRESARIQSFPDTFVFIGGKGSQLKQVGNAVPPLMAREIAKQLLSQL